TMALEDTDQQQDKLAVWHPGLARVRLSSVHGCTLTDRHQAGITPCRSGVDTDGSFQQQALQRYGCIALRQPDHTHDGSTALGDLLADLAQLVGIAVMQHDVEIQLFRRPVGRELYAGTYLLRQAIS